MLLMPLSCDRESVAVGIRLVATQILSAFGVVISFDDFDGRCDQRCLAS